MAPNVHTLTAGKHFTVTLVIDLHFTSYLCCNAIGTVREHQSNRYMYEAVMIKKGHDNTRQTSDGEPSWPPPIINPVYAPALMAAILMIMIMMMVDESGWTAVGRPLSNGAQRCLANVYFTLRYRSTRCFIKNNPLCFLLCLLRIWSHLHKTFSKCS